MKKMKSYNIFIILLILTLFSVFHFKVIAIDNNAIDVPVNIMNVTVPTNLPIIVDSYGNVSVSENTSIHNNGSYPVRIVSVSVRPMNDWQIVSFNKDFNDTVISTKEFGMIFNGEEVTEFGDVGLTFPEINAGSSLDFSYNANVAPQMTSINNLNIAEVVFVLDMDVPTTLELPIIEDKPKEEIPTTLELSQNEALIEDIQIEEIQTEEIPLNNEETFYVEEPIEEEYVYPPEEVITYPPPEPVTPPLRDDSGGFSPSIPIDEMSPWG